MSDESTAAASDEEPREATAPSFKKEPSEPFWNSPWIVALLGFLTASIAPVTAATTKSCEMRMTERQHDFELRLAEQEQRHKIRMDYFSRAVDPANDPEYRERVLRFLASADDAGDPALRAWAQEELDRVEAQLLELRQMEAQLAQLRTESRQARERAERDATVAHQRELERVQEALATAEARARAQCEDSCGRRWRPCHDQCTAITTRTEGELLLDMARACAEQCATQVFACRRACASSSETDG